jgi:tripartite-type tricarboxylate transporter receptor subunit TctC
MKRIVSMMMLAAATVWGGPILAQEFPDRPITMVNPYAAGGPADLIARTIAEPMGEALGQPVVVENRPGAGTAIAATHVTGSDPDGYTLIIAGSPTHVVTPALTDAGFDGIEDFAPVAAVVVVPNVLVVPADRPYETLDELIAEARERQGSMTFASVGIGSLPQFLGVLLQQRAEIELTHVPYGGAAPAVTDLVAGNVDMGFLNVPAALGHVRDGTLRAIAIANTNRSPQLPDVPTMEELGYDDFVMNTWYGISAPAGTPDEIIAKLDSAIGEAMSREQVAQTLGQSSVELFYLSAGEFDAFMRSDAELMLELIEAADMRAE